MKLLHTALGLVLSALLVFGVATPAVAHRGNDDNHAETSSASSPSASPEQQTHHNEQEHEFEHQSEALKESVEKIKQEVEQKRSDRKDENRIKRCQDKEQDSKQRFEKIQAKSGEIKDRIAGILARVEAYVSKNNIQAPNSAALLADIQAKQQAVEAALAEVKATAQGFSCQNDDAKEQASLIKAQVEAYKAAVKAYREAVRNYLDAVLAVVSPSASPSPEASATPSPTTNGGV